MRRVYYIEFSDYLASLQSAIQGGSPCLLENVGEQVANLKNIFTFVTAIVVKVS
jgi:hypothetical protein